MSAGAILIIAGFLALLVFVIWLGRKQTKELDSWLDTKVASEGWVSSTDDSTIEEQGWSWLQSMGASRDVQIDRLAVNPDRGEIEAAFTLITRRYGERAGAKRPLGVGLIARLPRPVSARFIAAPVPSAGIAARAGSFLQSFLGLDLPAVSVGDEHLAHRWSIWSQEPEAAARALESDPALRSTLASLFEAVWEKTRFSVLILELNGDRVALIGGPKTVGRQPFSDLEEIFRQFGHM